MEGEATEIASAYRVPRTVRIRRSISPSAASAKRSEPAQLAMVGRSLRNPAEVRSYLAGGETVILLHPPLPLVGVSIETMRECSKMTESLTASRSRAPEAPRHIPAHGTSEGTHWRQTVCGGASTTRQRRSWSLSIKQSVLHADLGEVDRQLRQQHPRRPVDREEVQRD